MPLLTPRLRAQIVKELLSVFQDPRSRFVLIIGPLMQLLVFAFAATLEVRHVEIAVQNQDQGHWSRELIARIEAAAFVDRVRLVETPAAARNLIEGREVIAAIAIPEDFSRDIARGQPASVQVIVDGRRANAGQVTVGYLEQVAAGLGADLATTGFGMDEVAVTRHLFNPNLEYLWFIVPSLAGTLATFITLIVTALSIARERELGTFDQLLVSPTTPFEIIIAKTVPALLIGTVLGFLMMGAAVVAFQIPFVGSFALLAGCLPLYILSVVGIGLVISAISATQQQAILGAFSVGIPMVLLSGFATPVENMPVFLQWMAEAVPLKHFLLILQGSFLKALPVPVAIGYVWPIIVIACVTLTGSIFFVRSRLQ